MEDPVPAWRRLVEQLTARGFDAGRLAPPASEEITADLEDSFGMPLHADVLALYRETGGMPAADEGWPPELYAEVAFPAPAEAVETALGMRAAAASPGMPEGLWQDAWLPVFVLWGDHLVAVDCRTGAVWFVWWEDTRIHRVARSLAEYFGLWAALVRDGSASYDPGGGTWQRPPGDDSDTVPSESID